MSQGDFVATVETEVDAFLGAGTRLVWVVNPFRKTVTVYRPAGEPRLHVLGDVLDGEDVLTGFDVTVREIFA